MDVNPKISRSLGRRATAKEVAESVGVSPATVSNAFADPVSVMFLEGVSEAAEEARLGLLLVPGTPREERGPAAVGEAAVDGFVVYCMAEDDPLVDAAME